MKITSARSRVDTDILAIGDITQSPREAAGCKNQPVLGVRRS
jgi:hypothetical protein